MFIELIDMLRCTRPHEDSWLVATFHEMRERDVVQGLLSCPVCTARYPITGGVAYFDELPGAGDNEADATMDDGTRIAAYLNLVEPGVVVLGGTWSGAAAWVSGMGSTVIALNSPREPDGYSSHVRSSDVLPMARETVDGIALDSGVPGLLESAAHALKTGARLVAPAAAAVPTGLLKLAHDDRWWVAARQGGGASGPVQIARGQRLKSSDG